AASGDQFHFAAAQLNAPPGEQPQRLAKVVRSRPIHLPAPPNRDRAPPAFETSSVGWTPAPARLMPGRSPPAVLHQNSIPPPSSRTRRSLAVSRHPSSPHERLHPPL